jgi:hypothetical protein
MYFINENMLFCQCYQSDLIKRDITKLVKTKTEF